MSGCSVVGHSLMVGIHGIAGAAAGAVAAGGGATALSAWGHRDTYGHHIGAAVLEGALGGLLVQGLLGAGAQALHPHQRGQTRLQRLEITGRHLAGFGTLAALFGGAIGAGLLTAGHHGGQLTPREALAADATGTGLLAGLALIFAVVPCICLLGCCREAEDIAHGRAGFVALDREPYDPEAPEPEPG